MRRIVLDGTNSRGNLPDILQPVREKHRDSGIDRGCICSDPLDQLWMRQEDRTAAHVADEGIARRLAHGSDRRRRLVEAAVAMCQTDDSEPSDATS